MTDPPWGFFSDKEPADLENFYSKMLREFERVIKTNGVIVVLMGQKEIFKKVLRKFSKLELEKKYDVLVSGKKAGIFKIRSRKLVT